MRHEFPIRKQNVETGKYVKDEKFDGENRVKRGVGDVEACTKERGR